MEKLIEFVGSNFEWFLTISIILLFALIGYIVDSKRTSYDLFKQTEEQIDAMSLENISNAQEKSLADIVNISKNINPETKSVELVDESILSDTVTNNNE